MSSNINQLLAFVQRRTGTFLAVLFCVIASALWSEKTVASHLAESEALKRCVPVENVSDAVREARPFRMAIVDVFLVTKISPDPMVTGHVTQGEIKVGDEVEIVGLKKTAKAKVTFIERHRKLVSKAKAGENVGIVLRVTQGDKPVVGHDSPDTGRVLAKPGSMRAYSNFEAKVYNLTKEEVLEHIWMSSSQRVTPISSGQRVLFHFGTKKLMGEVTLPESLETIRPGDCKTIEVKLDRPVAMDKDQRFAVRKLSELTEGVGVVTRIGFAPTGLKVLE